MERQLGLHVGYIGFSIVEEMLVPSTPIIRTQGLCKNLHVR